MLERIKKIFLFISLFLLFLLSDLIYLVPFKLLNINYDKLNYNLQVLCSLTASLIVSLIIVLVYKKYLKKCFKDYTKNFSKYFDIGMKSWFVGLALMCFFNVLISLLTPVHDANNEVLVQNMLKEAPLLSFISASLIAPFEEEMLFRKSFGDIFKNKYVMILASGFLFGFLHVIFSLKTPWDLLYIIPYGSLGGAFAYSLRKTNNIFLPITFHMLHNGILTLTSIFLTVI